MIRRGLGVGGAIALVALALVATASAASPEGPRLAYGQWGPGGYSVSLLSIDPVAGQPHPLFRAHRRTRPVPLPFAGPSWFPDGSALAFTGLTGNLSGNGPSGSRIFVVGADGGTPRPLARTEGADYPVVSPDGRTLAFALTRERTRVQRRRNTFVRRLERAVSTWLLDMQSGKRWRLTPWRYGMQQVPTSFSPDGSMLAVTRVQGRSKVDTLTVGLDGTGASVLLRNAAFAVFSPGGDRIAYLKLGRAYRERTREGVATLRRSDLFVKGFDGSGSGRLTTTPKRSEGYPSWDPSGQRLAFVQFGTAMSLSRTLGAGNAIVQINADGSCRTKTLSWEDAVLFGSTWRPGPGRGAGRIAC